MCAVPSNGRRAAAGRGFSLLRSTKKRRAVRTTGGQGRTSATLKMCAPDNLVGRGAFLPLAPNRLLRFPMKHANATGKGTTRRKACGEGCRPSTFCPVLLVITQGAEVSNLNEH